MTRKEEIEKAAMEYHPSSEYSRFIFREGAEWADKNPEKNLRNRIQMRLDSISRYPDDLHCTMYQMKEILKDFLK
jgi:hypothetical protein